MKWQHDHCWTQQLLRFGKLEGRVGLNRMKRLHRGVQLLAYLWTSQTSSWSTLLPLSLLSPLILHLLHQVFYPSLPLKPFTFKSSSETSHLHPSTTTPNAKYSLILVDTSAFLYIATFSLPSCYSLVLLRPLWPFLLCFLWCLLLTHCFAHSIYLLSPFKMPPVCHSQICIPSLTSPLSIKL